MRLLTEQSATIACSVDSAYRYASNLERFGEWFPGVLRIVSTDTLDHGVVGKEYLETVSIPFQGQREVRIRVREARTDELFVTEGTLSPLLPRMEILFRASGPSACSVTWRMLSRNEGWLARLALLPLASRVLTERATRAMVRLKTNLEAPSSP